MAGKVMPKFGNRRDPSMRNQAASAKALKVAQTPGMKAGVGSGGPVGPKVVPNNFGMGTQKIVMGSIGGGSGLKTSPAIHKPSRMRRKAKMV